MPLIRSSKPENVSQNISEMMKAGYAKDQAVAAAMSEARKAIGKKYSKKTKKTKINYGAKNTTHGRSIT